MRMGILGVVRGIVSRMSFPVGEFRAGRNGGRKLFVIYSTQYAKYLRRVYLGSISVAARE